MRSNLGALALGATILLAQPTFAGGEHWVEDFDVAAAQAKKEGKDLLVDFTGSDWCGWCIKLDKEVFAHDAFLESATKQYVLVSLDFPRGAEAKAKVPNPERNDELQRKYEVRGFPAILLMTAEGEVYGQTGYQPGGPEKYLEHIAGLRGARAVIPFIAKWDAAEGDARDALAIEAIDMLSGLSYGNVMGTKLKPAVEHAMQSDLENKRGVRAKAVKALLATGNGDEATVAAANALDPRNELGLREWALRSEVESVRSEEMITETVKKIDEFLALGKVHDDEAVFMIWVYGAFWNKQFQNDLEKAKKFAGLAKEIGTDNPQIEDLLKGILES
ncbi:MAG: thioredoxin family protein [bacterium]|nr:thioredoxin family protein [bacterium]